MPTLLAYSDYRAKVLGCWLGKAIGGTLGGPFEGHPGPLDLTFYRPVPERMLPNDDLDLQVVWLATLRRHGLPVDRELLGRAWLAHNRLFPDEYGVACANLAAGLAPPVSGWYDNPFTAGMGAAIRSELWACLAPGDPDLARALALEDACVDHADEGLYAELYLTTLQSAAFVQPDRERLLNLAMRSLPPTCRVARAVADVRRWWAELADLQAVRERVLDAHGRQNFTDVAQNLAFIILGWLAGTDFGSCLCAAVNCGADTDCTGATLGALLGILDPAGLPAAWLRPIGRDLVLSPQMVGLHAPATLDEFTDQVAALSLDVLRYYRSDVSLTDPPPLEAARRQQAPPRHAHPELVMLRPTADMAIGLLATEPLIVELAWPEDVALLPAQPADLAVNLRNPLDRHLDVIFSARLPEGWGGGCGPLRVSLTPGQTASIGLTVLPPEPTVARACANPLDLRFEVDGLSWTISAGLPLSRPWRRWALNEPLDACPEVPLDATFIEAESSTQPLPAGPHAFATEFKLPYGATPRWVVQAPRAVTVWLDGEPLLSHDGGYRVPATHRCGPTGADRALRAGWHRLTVVVGDGEAGDDLFARPGWGEGWHWLQDVEWRVIGTWAEAGEHED